MEILGLYDKNGLYLNESIERKNKTTIQDGRYYKVVMVFIINSKGQILVQKSSERKGNIFEILGGHVKDKRSSRQTVIDELNEELSLKCHPDEITFFKKYIYDDTKDKYIQEVFYITKDIDERCLKCDESEVSFVKWLYLEQINRLIDNGDFREKNIKPYYEFIRYLKEAKQ